MIDTPLIDTKEGRPFRTALLPCVSPLRPPKFFNDTPASGGRFSGPRLAFGLFSAARKTPAAAAEPRAPTAARLRRAAVPLPPQELPAARPRRADRAPSRRARPIRRRGRPPVRCSEIIARSPCTLETVTVFFEPRPMLMTCAVRIPGGTGSPSAISRCARRASTV